MLVALTAVLAAVAVPLAAQSAVRSETFRIFLRGTDIGSEEVTVLQSPDGWILRGSGGVGAPFDVTLKFWEARYDQDWRPRELTLDLSVGSTPRILHTRIAGISAVSEIGSGEQATKTSATVNADALFLPPLIFGTYEALAARLATAVPGTELHAFLAPQGEVAIRPKSVSNETIQVSTRMIEARRWVLTYMNPGAPVDFDIWTESGRLLRIDIPAQMISVVRDDVATVAARRVTAGRANDEQAAIPAYGFNLAATVSKPADAPAGRLPAVVLVSGSSLVDRDEIVAGVPIFGQLAGALADAGFLVVRYDKRGVGQSGGRLDVVTLADFAEDARAVIKWTAKRKDVDARRVALVGYGEGAWVALQAAMQESSVAALVLIAGGSVPGSDLVLEQQQHVLDRSGMTTAERQQAVERQKKILGAVVSGKGWEGVPANARERADTAWYRSFLLFDPSRVISKTRQPILVVHGDLDREIEPHHGDRLAELARLRPKSRGADLVKVHGVNHLLTRATTGETDEYARLTERSVALEVPSEIVSWLQRTLAPAEAGKIGPPWIARGRRRRPRLTDVAALLVPQRLDCIEPRRAHRRPHSAEHPGQDENRGCQAQDIR